jgi:antitoxin MazE
MVEADCKITFRIGVDPSVGPAGKTFCAFGIVHRAESQWFGVPAKPRSAACASPVFFTLRRMILQSASNVLACYVLDSPNTGCHSLKALEAGSRSRRGVQVEYLPARCYIVITMKRTQIAIRRIGNSQGIVIPKPLLAQIGLEGHAEMTIERDALVLRRPAKAPRAGWAAAAQKLATQDDDALVMGEFGNEDDAGLSW